MSLFPSNFGTSSLGSVATREDASAKVTKILDTGLLALRSWVRTSGKATQLRAGTLRPNKAFEKELLLTWILIFHRNKLWLVLRGREDLYDRLNCTVATVQPCPFLMATPSPKGQCQIQVRREGKASAIVQNQLAARARWNVCREVMPSAVISMVKSVEEK